MKGREMKSQEWNGGWRIWAVTEADISRERTRRTNDHHHWSERLGNKEHSLTDRVRREKKQSKNNQENEWTLG